MMTQPGQRPSRAMRPRLHPGRWLLVLMVSPLFALAAQDKVQLNAISRVELKGATVEIQGSRRPSFTTFTLSDPPRLVIDISEAVFQAVPPETKVGQKGITAIKTASYGSESAAIARVIVGFEKELETDIAVQGTTLIVSLPPDPSEQKKVAQEKAETERQARLGAEREAKEAKERAEADAKAKALAEKSAKEEADRLAREEVERTKKKAEEERLAKVAAEKAQKEETARLAKEEAERKKREAEEAMKKAEEERLAKVAAEKAQREEAEAKARAEAEQRKRDAEEAKRKAEEERLAKVAAEKAQKEEAARLEAERQEEERQRKLAEKEEKARKKREAEEAKRRAEEDEKARQLAEKEERARKMREAEAEEKARLAAAEPRSRKQREPEEGQKVAAADGAGRKRPDDAAQKRRDLEDAAARTPPPEELARAGVRVTFIGFKQENGVAKVYVRTTGPVKYAVGEDDERAVVLTLEKARVTMPNNQRILDASFFDTAVSLVRPEETEDGRVLVKVTLKRRVAYRASQQGNELSLEFEKLD